MINKSGLTGRRKEILETVIDFINEHNRSPLIKEIAEELGLTDPTISSHLDTLEEQGYIERKEGQGVTVKETPPYSDYVLIKKDVLTQALDVLRGDVEDKESKVIVIQNIESKLKERF